MPVPERTASKSWARTSARERIRQRYFPNVLLTTHEEKKVHLYDDLIKDKVVVLNFFYATCNGICVPTTANLVRVQALLREHMTHDLFMYSFTLKPSEDSPGVLRDYATRFRVGPGWLFLTGDPADLELIRRRTGFT